MDFMKQEFNLTQILKVFCFFNGDKLVILMNGFQKKTNFIVNCRVSILGYIVSLSEIISLSEKLIKFALNGNYYA